MKILKSIRNILVAVLRGELLLRMKVDKVLIPVAAPLLICVMMKSSMDITNAITNPLTMPGVMMGIITFVKALNGFAPRARAAS